MLPLALVKRADVTFDGSIKFSDFAPSNAGNAIFSRVMLPSATDVVASVEIGGADITLSGYTVPASPSAVTSADTVNEAIGKLEAQIAVAGLAAVTSGNGISVSAVDPATRTQSISAVAPATTSASVANPISVTANGIEFAGVLDCGTY